MRVTSYCGVVLVLIASNVLAQGAVPWPVTNISGIGNNYGAFQQYGGDPAYLHDGLDILTPPGTTVFAVADGTVTHVTVDSGGLYSGVMVGTASDGGMGYLYWHLDTVSVIKGAEIKAGMPIGTVTYWPVPAFHHLHFSRVRGTGGYPWAWYEPLDNPAHLLSPRPDTQRPTINATFHFFDPTAGEFVDRGALRGTLDVVIEASDIADDLGWRLAPHRLQLLLHSESPPVLLGEIIFEGPLGIAWQEPDILFATAPPPTVSAGDYSQRKFYLVATNVDGTPGFSSTDRDSAWDTRQHADGNYVLEIVAVDSAGNEGRASVEVHIQNMPSGSHR